MNDYIKEKLKCKFFCRYMDDLIILSHDKEYLKNKKCSKNLDYNEIASLLDNRSCAALETVLNEAGVYAGYECRKEIEMNDNLLKLRSVLKTMPLNDNQINNILGIIDIQNKEIDDTIAPLLEEYYSYGIERDYTNSSPNCIRIGNLDLHRSLPIQSKIRGCLLDDDGNIVEYLPENDWTTAIRDGSKGQVMVHIPHHYRRFYTKDNNNIICARISELPLKGYHYVPDMFVSAYEASIEHSTGKLCSVMNDSADYRGGNNKSEWDGTYRSLLGRPVTNISRSQFRSAARKRNITNTSWNCYLYNVHKALFWLYIIEYANFNSQIDYTSEFTSDGLRQGGLGIGVSDLTNAEWNFNNSNPFIPCGYTDSLGNNTGVMSYTIYNKDGSIASIEQTTTDKDGGNAVTIKTNYENGKVVGEPVESEYPEGFDAGTMKLEVWAKRGTLQNNL